MEVEHANPPWNARERTLIAKMKRFLENGEKSKWESESWSISCSILKMKQVACFPQSTRGTGELLVRSDRNEEH